MAESDPMREFLNEREIERTARIKAQEEVLASPAYQEQLKFLRGITLDVVQVLELCLTYSGRNEQSAKNSLVIRSTDDFGQSVVSRAEFGAGWADQSYKA